MKQTESNELIQELHAAEELAKLMYVNDLKANKVVLDKVNLILDGQYAVLLRQDLLLIREDLRTQIASDEGKLIEMGVKLKDLKDTKHASEPEPCKGCKTPFCDGCKYERLRPGERWHINDNTSD